MLGALIAAVLLAGACAYLVGYAFVMPHDSFLRSAAGGFTLACCVLVALVVPPALAAVAAAGGGRWWPTGLDPTVYRAAWIALMTVGLLAGLRVWRSRLFRPGARWFALDESPVGRAEAALPLADSLEDALDVLGRERAAARDMPRLALTLRRVGSRFWHQLPEASSDVYALVARRVPSAIAADVTGLLLEGAGRKG